MLEELYSDNLVDKEDDIERVIEGEELERKDGSEHGSDNEEEKNKDEKDKEKEITKIKRKQGPRIVLNAQRLRGPRGLGVMETFFSDIPDKLRGKGREKEDLDLVMGRLEHWAHRMMPRLQFDDCLKKVETLGSKRLVINMVKRIRLGLEEDETIPAEVLHREDMESPPPDRDPFDELMSSSAPTRPADTDITAEQREQMLRNRLIAEERRAARLKKAQEMKEKFRAQQITNSQLESSQVTAMEVATEENPQTGAESHQDNVEHGRNQLDAGIGVEEISSNSGTEIGEGCEIQIDSVKNKDEPGIQVPKNEVSNEEKEGCLEVPEEMSQDEINPAESGGDENQLDALEERGGNQPDILVERGENEGVLNENQPDILARRDGIESDILSMRLNSSSEVPEGNENQPDISVVRNESRPDVVLENINEHIHVERDRNIIENQPKAMEVNENQPVELDMVENHQPDILPDTVDNNSDVLTERMGNQTDILTTERSVNQPDVLI